MTESENSVRQQEQTTRKHLASHVASTVDKAIRTLAPTGTRVEIRALFGNKVDYQAIHHWRKGRRAIPQWAVDMITPQLRRIGSLADTLESFPRRDKGAIGAAHLRRLHQRKRADRAGPFGSFNLVASRFPD